MTGYCRGVVAGAPIGPLGRLPSPVWRTGTRFANSLPRVGRRSLRAGGSSPQGGQRRVPGLRRGEVAMLAGVSSEYYTRLERGNLGGVSDTVLDAVANALQLDEAERDHLFDLARIAGRPTRRSPKQSMPKTVRPVVQRLSRRDDRSPRIGPQRPPRHPRRQRFGLCPLLRGGRQSGPPGRVTVHRPCT